MPANPMALITFVPKFERSATSKAITDLDQSIFVYSIRTRRRVRNYHNRPAARLHTSAYRVWRLVHPRMFLAPLGITAVI